MFTSLATPCMPATRPMVGRMVVCAGHAKRNERTAPIGGQPDTLTGVPTE